MNVQPKSSEGRRRTVDHHYQDTDRRSSVLMTSSEDVKHMSCAMWCDDGVILGSTADAVFEFVSTREYQ